jgi:hypothetical protein
MKKANSTFWLVTFVLWAAQMASAQVIYVNKNASIGGTGTSWATAYNNLQEAINQATTEQIWVAKGSYSPSQDSTGQANPVDLRQKTFFINKNIQIIGGFAGTETLASQANPSLNPTLLSGELGSPADSTDNAYHILFLTNTNNSNGISSLSLFKNITITGSYGFANTSGTIENFGGAVYFNATGNAKTMSPRFEQVLFERNYARIGGACYLNTRGATTAPVFENCSFVQNAALGSTPASPSGSGGAFRFNTTGGLCAAKFDFCFFENNRAGSAGAIYNILFLGNSYIEIQNSYFIKNRAATGGVMYNCSNHASVINKPLLINNVFSQNQGTTRAGVIYNIANSGESSATVLNCSFSNNIAPEAAAVYSRANSSAVSATNLKNCIVWNNTTAQNEAVNLAGGPSTITFDHCLTSDGNINGTISASYGNTFSTCIEANPMFANVNDLNGADNIFRTADDGLNVSLGSPCINAGDNIVVNSSIASTRQAKINAINTDITGVNARIIDGTVDLGGFETTIPVSLPLILQYFEIFSTTNGTVQLRWATVQEVDIKRFEIEKSNNAKEFLNIGTVLSNNEFRANVYTFNHVLPKITTLENAYYRLKILENNGKVRYSKIVVSTNEYKANLVVIGALPAISELPVINNNATQSAKIFGIHGQLITEIVLVEGQNSLNTSGFLPGIYFLKTTTGQVLKFSKQ